MKKTKILFIIIVVSVFGYGFTKWNSEGAKKAVLPAQSTTETFIVEHLEANNHLIRTNITDRTDEYLSESVGLWLVYLEEVGNEGRFAKQVEAFDEYFYQKGQIIPWVINGSKRENINASIDDLRIMLALHNADEQFQSRAYRKKAKAIGQFVVEHQVVDGIITDFYDPAHTYASNVITLSYIIPEAYEYLQQQKLLSEEDFLKNQALLLQAPRFANDVFFPKNYDVEAKAYQYDQEVNMIDQYYVGFHRAAWGGDVEALIQFTEEKLATDGKIYGGYSLRTQQPNVTYESASMYALAILMMLEAKEHALAQQLWDLLQALRVNDEYSEYYGGYIDVWSHDTHMFDNVLPLIAERRGVHAGVFKE